MHSFWKNLEMFIFLYITVEAEIIILAKNFKPIEKLTFDLSFNVTHIGTDFYISKHPNLRIQLVA